MLFFAHEFNVELKIRMMMIAKKMNLDMLIDLTMTRLFQLAEYVCNRFSSKTDESTVPTPPAPSLEEVPPIRFSHEDRMVEGELFK